MMMTNKKIIGVRDPFGIRPLVIGHRFSKEKNMDEWMIASES